MSESDTASVECPLCGEAFDPTAAGGWCTNSECGEWQHERDDADDQHLAAAEDGSKAAAEDGSNDDAGASADDTDPLDDVHDDGGDGADEPATDAVRATAETDEEVAANGAGVAESAEPAADADASADADPDSSSGDETAEQETFECSGCGTSLAADVNFCPNCGEDVSHLPGGDELDACPSCGGDVDADDNFCAQCGEDLDAHRGGADVLTECPDCGADVDEDDSFCAGCGADLDAHRAGEAADAGSQAAGSAVGSAGSTEATAPDALALTAHGKSIVVDDGDVVGRDIRSLLTDAGRPEDEAVRVHREHVRFARESGQFYVVALGQNPTRVNGTSLAQGERGQIAPGDELELSDVVTLNVEAA